jgi:hypothetical protein
MGDDGSERQQRIELEVEELNGLKELQNDGEEIDEKRLYELQLFDWERRGFAVSDEETKDLKLHKQRRKRLKRHRKEYTELVEKEGKGESVDAGRLYCLELVDRNFCREQLTDEELEDLDQFDEDEVRREAEQSRVKKQGQAPSPAIKMTQDAAEEPADGSSVSSEINEHVDTDSSDGSVEEETRAEEPPLAEKGVVSDEEAGAVNIVENQVVDADAIGHDKAIGKDSEGGSPTKNPPSEERNDPFASDDAFGAGFDATNDGFGVATDGDGWNATVDKPAQSKEENEGFDDDFGKSFDDPFGSSGMENIEDKEQGQGQDMFGDSPATRQTEQNDTKLDDSPSDSDSESEDESERQQRIEL